MSAVLHLTDDGYYAFFCVKCRLEVLFANYILAYRYVCKYGHICSICLDKVIEKC